MSIGSNPIQVVILAGGSGTRLWPSSRRDRPKQLLALNSTHSLLQETALRLRGFTATPLAPEPVVIANREYHLAVSGQLREVGIEHARLVLEPVGRNTAPALTAACLAIADGDDPILLVMASDHVIQDAAAFQEAVAKGAALAAGTPPAAAAPHIGGAPLGASAPQAETGALVLFGVVPDHPETGYGYIQVGEPVAGGAHRLAGFKEKPDRATAETYLAAGSYLWNSGMFMVKRSVWLAAIRRHRPDIYAACRAALPEAGGAGDAIRLSEAAFRACPAESIDCAVVEELAGAGAGDGATGETAGAYAVTGGAVVIPLDCGWSDVGGWAALAQVSTPDAAGNVLRGQVVLEDSRNTLVHADSRLVAVLGVDDLVIVDTDDALLVAAKDKTGDLKELVARVQEVDEKLTLRHRRQYWPWGHFDSIDTGERFQVKHIVVDPGAMLSLQLHHHRAEHWVVVHGVAEVTCGDRVFPLGEDESTYIPIGTPHRLANPGSEPLDIIEVQSGDYLGEDDIVRLEDNYGRLGDA